MYVRWKSRQGHPRKPWRPGRRAQTAVLVTSARVDGRPRQRIVAYLGHFAEHWQPNVGYQHRFWERAQQRLAALELAPRTREHVEAQLRAVVPQPTEDKLAKWRKERDAFYQVLRQLARARRR